MTQQPAYDDTAALAAEEPELPLPEDFNIGEWIAGVQATVRSVNVYQRADLIAEIDQLEAQLQVLAALPEEERGLEEADERADMERRLVELHHQFVGSGVTFKVQGRSEGWLARYEREWGRHGDTNGMSKSEKTVYVQLHQLADSIVQPAGVTYELLAQLREASEPQIRKLLVAFALANNQAPKVTVPFSQRSSDNQRTRQR